MENKQYPHEHIQPDVTGPDGQPDEPLTPAQPPAPEAPEHLDVEALFAPIFAHTAPEEAAPETSETVMPETLETTMPEILEAADIVPDQVPEQAPQEPVQTVPSGLDAPAEEVLTDARMTAPELGREIEADDAAMVGMLAHGEPEPPFDLSILDDPELEVPQEPQPEAEEADEQEYRDNGQEQQTPPPAQKRPVPPRPRPLRKGRPKRKKGEGMLGLPSMAATLVWLGLILAIGVTAGRMLWVCAADVLAFGREDKPVTVTIYESDTMDNIVDKLYDAGLIRYKSLFNLYAAISDAQEDIQPGIYDLNTRYDYHALVNFMSPRSSREVVKLTIPEGYTCRQIFKLLEENRICTARDIGAYAATGELEPYWFLEQVERGTEYCLEGFLFPDTYQFYKNSSPKEALEKMLDNFDYRFSEEMRAQLDTLNANVTGGGYGVREVTIVASLIEKESAAPAESPAIAGVIYNRLFRWGDTPAYLNIDASLVYAQGGDNTAIDTSIDSPFNTYTHTGLTPTPIANPGLSSLKAALAPEMHEYYYYVLNPSTGMHQFAKTYEEHEANRTSFAAAAAAAESEGLG